jgi:hypothetical protein
VVVFFVIFAVFFIVCTGMGITMVVTGIRFTRGGIPGPHANARHERAQQARKQMDIDEVNAHWDKMNRKWNPFRWVPFNSNGWDSDEELRAKELRMTQIKHNRPTKGYPGSADPRGAVHPGHGHTHHGVGRSGFGTRGHKLRLPEAPKPKPRPAKAESKWVKRIIG